MARVARIALGVIIALLLGVAALGRLYYNQHNLSNEQRNVVSCISDWANKYTERVNAVTTASSTRNDALDRLIRTLAEPTPKLRADFPKEVAAYISASDAYKQTLSDNPIPKSPQLLCK